MPLTQINTNSTETGKSHYQSSEAQLDITKHEIDQTYNNAPAFQDEPLASFATHASLVTSLKHTMDKEKR